MNVTDLRKAFTAQGIKGAGKWNRADFNSTIIAAEFAAYDEDAARTPKPAKRSGKRICPICDLRPMYTGAANGEKAPRLSEMCNPCYAEGGWENTHSDSAHNEILETPEADRTEEQLAEIFGCWICYPELNLAQVAPKAGRSRAGMEIVAKGTEVHKSATFKAAAEAAGWTVTISVQEYEDGGSRHFADAHRGDDAIQLAWNGRAYDYNASSAQLKGKSRKVRNLKEALRLI